MPNRGDRLSSLSAVAPLVDGLVVACASWLAYFARWDKWSMSLEYTSVAVLGTGLVLIVLPATGAYRYWRDELYWQNTGNALPGFFLVAVLLILAGALTKTTADFSRLWMAYWFACTLAGLVLFRWLSWRLARLLDRGQPHATRVLVVGHGAFAAAVAQRLRGADWDVAAIVSPFRQTDDDSTHTDAAGVSLTELDALIAAPDNALDEIWIAMDSTVPDRQEAVIRILQTSSLTVRYVPDLSTLALLSHTPAHVAGMTVIDLNTSPLTGINQLIKSAVDKLLALGALTLLAPVMLLIAVLIKLDSAGPVFFVQKRHGWDGKVIEVLKFRTMHHHPPALQDTRQARPNDPRTTSVGRFLRKTSLDELPQFFNVLRGDMSVVGPRPHPLALNQSYAGRIDAYMQRHRVKPGITGWAQIHGLRGETETLEKMQKRIEHDLYYIEHWSLWLDIKIILLTLVAGWTSKNAY
ncbi:MAG: undecaprenyl-phosphate glucose phosphotransferase [Halioglobus sp.]